MTDWLLNSFPILFAILTLGALATFVIVRMLQRAKERRARKPRKALPPGHFVFAKIMDPVLPMLRGDKYEEPLDQALQSQGLGSVVGGGTQMGDGNSVAWVGLDLELRNLEGALEFTRKKLRELGAPQGSVLEYRVGERRTTLEI
jgi:hypothetical protein